jgi:hypothetical protein
MAAIYSLHAERPPVAQVRRGGPIPKAIPSLVRVRRERIEQKLDAEIARERQEGLRDALLSLHGARISALADLAQPDSVLAARVRQRAAEAVRTFDEQIADFERRVGSGRVAAPD